MPDNNDKEQKSGLIPYPILTMLLIGTISGLIVGLSFILVPVMPLPQATVPVFGFNQGFIWGFVVGSVTGLVIGWLTDDKHFKKPE